MLYKATTFSEEDTKGKDFEKDIFTHCKLVNLNFRFVSFKNCEFKLCDFSGSTFDIVGFNNCKFPETKLSNLEFSGADIKSCDFSQSVMYNCVFQKLKGASKSDRKKFNLTNCKFENTDLSGTIFAFCDLNKVSFINAKLGGVIFDKCDLKDANFVGAEINVTNFSNSHIEKTHLDINGFISFGNSKGFILDAET